MTLKQKLDALKEGFKKRAPKTAQAIMQRATEDLIHSDTLANAVKVGDTAPGFILKDTRGKDVSLAALIEKTPVVLTFYRGNW